MSDVDFLWETAKLIWPNDKKFAGQKNATQKADVFIQSFKRESNFDDFFSLGTDMVGNQNQVQKLFKVSRATIDGYAGTYYGEQSFNVNQPGVNKPHGKGVFVVDDGWIWIQWFENG